MHRGFLYYYREGLNSSKKTLYRNKCFFRYILYFLAEFFGRILIIFNSLFDIANVRQGYIIRKANKLNFASSFRSVGQRAPIGTYILTLCLEGLIIIAGVVATAILAVILGSIGYAISKIASYANYNLFIMIFAAPAGLILLLYVLVSILIFSPTAYIITNNVNISAGETIGTCYISMINNGKMTVFLSYFVSMLLRVLYWGGIAVAGYFVFTKLVPDKYFVISVIGSSILAFVGYLLFAPILTLTNRVVKEHLFEDIVLDPAVAVRINEKVNLSVCEGKAVEIITDQSLSSLFEYTEDPYRILEVTERKSQRFEVEAPETVKKKDKKKSKVKDKKETQKQEQIDWLDEPEVKEKPKDKKKNKNKKKSKQEEESEQKEFVDSPAEPDSEAPSTPDLDVTAEPNLEASAEDLKEPDAVQPDIEPQENQPSVKPDDQQTE